METTASGRRPVRLHIICEQPPRETPVGQDIQFGLQDVHQQLHPGVYEADGTLRFTCEAQVKPHRTTGKPDLSGPFIHGSAGARFLYLSLRQPGGDWIRRLKISLATISWAQIDTASQSPTGVLVARISGEGSGTVPPLEDWAANPG